MKTDTGRWCDERKETIYGFDIPYHDRSDGDGKTV
jgi:hypothetical protein